MVLATRAYHYYCYILVHSVTLARTANLHMLQLAYIHELIQVHVVWISAHIKYDIVGLAPLTWDQYESGRLIYEHNSARRGSVTSWDMLKLTTVHTCPTKCSRPGSTASVLYHLAGMPSAFKMRPKWIESVFKMSSGQLEYVETEHTPIYPLM